MWRRPASRSTGRRPVALSFWESREVITGFAGADISRAVFYPEDDRYLVAREDTGTHHEVHVG